jgi:hypothetical protein
VEARAETDSVDCGTQALILRAMRQLCAQAVLLLSLWLLLTASTCSSDAGFGDKLVSQGGVPAGVKDYKYVADSRAMLYWPNKPRYANAIPKANRVWIEDDATLKQFAGYVAGQR